MRFGRSRSAWLARVNNLGVTLNFGGTATSVAFVTAGPLPIDGPAGTQVTDVAKVLNQYRLIMNPQPSGTMSYASGDTGVATVNGATGQITTVDNGSATITATFTPS